MQLAFFFSFFAQMFYALLTWVLLMASLSLLSLVRLHAPLNYLVLLFVVLTCIYCMFDEY